MLELEVRFPRRPKVMLPRPLINDSAAARAAPGRAVARAIGAGRVDHTRARRTAGVCDLVCTGHCRPRTLPRRDRLGTSGGPASAPHGASRGAWRAWSPPARWPRHGRQRARAELGRKRVGFVTGLSYCRSCAECGVERSPGAMRNNARERGAAAAFAPESVVRGALVPKDPRGV